MVDASRTVLKYYLYRATSGPGFTYPIYTLFLLLNGLSYTEIGIIATIQALIVVGGEIPTGYVGDRIGRRNSLVIAAVMFLISNAGYLTATDFWGFLFVFGTLSFGHTFVSGSGSAWLYDTLQEHDIEGEYTRISGRAGAVSKAVQAVTMIAGGLLYVADPYYPFYAAVALSVLNVGLVLRLPKNAAYAADDERQAEGESLSMLDALPTIRDRITARELRWFVVYLSLFSGALMTADMYIQPVVRDALEQSFGAVLATYGVEEAATLGFFYASFMGVSAIGSDYAAEVESWLGVRKAMLLLPVGIAAFYLVPVVAPVAVFPMFFVMKGSNSLIFPISSRYINDHIGSVGRATVISAIAMVRAVAGVPFRVGSGAFADLFTPIAAVAALGVSFLVGAVLLYVFATPIREVDVPDRSGESTEATPGPVD
ncbi:MFS transporter [Halapricum hydrolyticum]|uniref:MFS transporter n=1 Tax=Halapricum hydrolyticum TaxID=2979991 RepID=A0AAE3IA74_9EURY|nr:MFS transporter [Halapricum hydrolyticum]MCU4717016.1 MFS transporter [Halapricum hydrolyticum]MCU4725378.1 MFS transporter [Halapricum hydrolyticum]